MKPIIEFSQVLQDSPKFREVLEQNEDNIDEFEHKLEKAVKQCQAMIDAAKVYQNIKDAFLINMTDLSFHFRCDRTVFSNLNKVLNALQELEGFQKMLTDSLSVILIKNLGQFIKVDVRNVKETKKYFDKISDDLDSALQRHSQMSRTKPHEGDAENINVLDAFRSCFRHTALDYVSQISCHQSKKRYEILEVYLSVMSAYNNYFHLGSELLADFQPTLKKAREDIRIIQEETAELTRDLDGRHNIVTSKDIVPILIRNPPSLGIKMEGYLFKRGTNAFKTWNRRWFIVERNRLVYRKRQHDDPNIMEPDLKLCTVKSVYDVDRKYCFEVVSPSKNHVLQADSEESYLQWVAALQEGINLALQATRENTQDTNHDAHSLLADSSMVTHSSYSIADKMVNNAFSVLMAVEGNNACCDCGQEAPKWASINLGVTLCIECSGIHRGLGVHVSKVRSLTLDAWEPELLKVMASLGNTLANEVYLALPPPPDLQPIKPDSNRPEREAWIKAKYVDKAFVKTPFPQSSAVLADESLHKTALTDQQQEELDSILYEASTQVDLPEMFKALATGGNPNWRNTSDSGHYCLHMTVLTGSMQCTEFLLLNGAKINVMDDNNMTPLHLATELGHTGLVCLLLKRGANQHIKNKEDKDALDIAVDTTNADIVTLLRLARFNEEMRNDEFGPSGDDTFNEVVRDFSNMASNFPEKLQRKPQVAEDATDSDKPPE